MSDRHFCSGTCRQPNRREQPKADEQQTGEAGPGFDDMPEQAEPAAEREARAEDDRQAQPDRQQLIERAQRDFERVEELHELSLLHANAGIEIGVTDIRYELRRQHERH